MSLEQKIQTDYIKAMKDKDPLKSGTLSFLRAQFKNLMIDKRQGNLSDEDVIAVMKKQVKQRKESIEQYEKGGRRDLADKELKELEILKSYLPDQMPEEELKAVIGEVIKESGATGIKDMGQVMKLVVSKVAGRADNKTISDIVRNLLTG